jgi:hypothetical protein
MWWLSGEKLSVAIEEANTDAAMPFLANVMNYK